MNIQYYEEVEESRHYTAEEIHQRYCNFDFKGIEIFTNIKTVTFISGGVAHYELGEPANHKTTVKNFDLLLKSQSVETLNLHGVPVKNYDFQYCKNLKTLKLINCENLNKITFGKNSKIETINLSGTGGSVDVSSLKNLKKFVSEDSHLRKIKFGNNKKLTKVIIHGCMDTKNKITSLNFSKVKNLKTLELWDLNKLKTLKLASTKKLKINILLCKNLKSLNLKKCKFPKKIKVINYTGKIIR